ncbi:helix-turn-helix transcriptional regulator [Bacillus massiliglaciei]|uniref:helix-turn-helix transcriptional regulator n=1 Tax=Bacillus massiliglaciei TaxID=1816693 RepID=UPI000DA62044|nr:helix-turn-helix domain-containing protein [Bacillus massiliglaciei]
MRKNLLIVRRESRLTQEKVAAVINISAQSYYLKENGKRDFSLTEAQLLAKYFNTTVDELFEQ